MVELITPRVRVTVEQEGRDDFLQMDVQTDNRDMVHWDVARAKKGWPTQRDAPILWLSFLAWHALKRSGETTQTVEKFLDSCVQVQGIDEDGNLINHGDAAAQADAWGEADSLTGAEAT